MSYGYDGLAETLQEATQASLAHTTLAEAVWRGPLALEPLFFFHLLHAHPAAIKRADGLWGCGALQHDLAVTVHRVTEVNHETRAVTIDLMPVQPADAQSPAILLAPPQHLDPQAWRRAVTEWTATAEVRLQKHRRSSKRHPQEFKTLWWPEHLKCFA